MQSAIFLDRDGVIIQNQPNYIRDWSEVQFFSQALEALAWLSTTSFKVVIITNQSVVGRGIVSLQAAEEINRRVVQEIQRAGGRIDGVFMCPHAPEDGCECRKPRPGLLRQAAQALSIDLPRSMIIGDALADLQAGQAAGTQRLVLVRTGRGADQEAEVIAACLPNLSIYDNLSQALPHLLT
jgi:D-glycero-D-manno-heptose 1,7-bisphosphate phosphatase